MRLLEDLLVAGAEGPAIEVRRAAERAGVADELVPGAAFLRIGFVAAIYQNVRVGGVSHAVAPWDARARCEAGALCGEVPERR